MIVLGNLKGLQQFDLVATVEAEFGSVLIKGGRITLAHHIVEGACPCLVELAGTVAPMEVIGVSHIDLDTVGGCGLLLNRKPGPRSFWELAALVDVTGPHNPAVRKHANYPELLAYWTWAQHPDNRAPRVQGDEPQAVDVSDLVSRHLSVIADIFGEGPEGSLHKAGALMAQAEAELESKSFLRMASVGGDDVILRSSENFVNHLYTHGDAVASAIVAFNEKYKSITLSFRDDAARKGRNAAEIMRKVSGPEAGGHPGIAGTPRNVPFTVDDLGKVIEAM